MSDLISKQCIPCSIGADPLSNELIKEYFMDLKEGWSVIDNKLIEKTYRFKDFSEALEFTNKIGALAEEEGHHPDISLSWAKVIVRLTTHKIKGLHDNDFILAAKIDELKY